MESSTLTGFDPKLQPTGGPSLKELYCFYFFNLYAKRWFGGIRGVRSVENKECGKCGPQKMRSVESAECRQCGVSKVSNLEAECGKYGV